MDCNIGITERTYDPVTGQKDHRSKKGFHWIGNQNQLNARNTCCYYEAKVSWWKRITTKTKYPSYIEYAQYMKDKDATSNKDVFCKFCWHWRDFTSDY